MSIDFVAQRVKMVDGQVRTTDVTQLELLDAMLSVPREEFVPAKRRMLAYLDEDIEILPPSGGKGGRYIMEASPFAKLVQLADLKPEDFVLVVGAGTGYSAAVISRIAGSVVALESDAGLAETATATLQRLGYDNVAVVTGPLTEGYPSQAPYDAILIEGAVDEVPEALLSQLRDHGRLLAIVGTGLAGAARLYVRDGDVTASRSAFNAAVQPLPGFQRQPQFQF
jgi:protein-L-isoaspartate(D-aspartate) O-methyltransferase